MDQNQNRAGLVFGGILITIGVLFFIAQFLDFMNWGSFWPVIIIGVGAAFFAGMVLGGKATGALAIPGSIITAVGLILFAQNVLGWWETWAYTWGLIIASVGVGIAIYGYWSDKPESVKSGWELARVGLILFLIFGAIFEFLFGFLGISDREGQLFWAFVIVALGLLQLGYRSFRLLTNPDAVTGDGRDLFGPVVLTGIGIIAVLAVLQVLPGLELFKLLSLWPLLLIAAGLQLIFGRRNPWLGAAIGVLMVAGVLFLGLAGERMGIRLGTPWMFQVGTQSENWAASETVQGSGNVVEETREFSGIEEVTLEAIGNLTIIQGEDEKLVITAEDNILERLTFEQSGNRLEIGVERGFGLSPTKTVEYVLTVKSLEEVNVRGAAEVNIGELTAQRLRLEASGAGSFNIEALQADRLDFNISGTGLSDIAGEVDEIDVSISGAGTFEGGNLQTRQAQVEISGLGKATVWVSTDLQVEITGAGTVAYYGDPDVDERITGAGTVQSLGSK